VKIFILEPRGDLDNDISPWFPWYDKSFGFVVRASSEENARKLADDAAGYENGITLKVKNPWLDEQYSICRELTSDGPEGVIMADYWNT